MRDFVTKSRHVPDRLTAGQPGGPVRDALARGQAAGSGWDLLARAQSGDPDALDQLCRENWLLVYRAVSRWASTQAEAEDLTQDVFVRAIQSLSSVRTAPAVPYRAYLLRTARNLVIDRWRARKPGTTSYHLLSEQSLLQLQDDRTGPEAAVIGRDEYQRVLEAIDRLPDAYSDVLRQRILLGRTAAEVGGQTGQTAGAIRQLQFRAMTALRRELAAAEAEEDRSE
jgi:RNA polymerase sigma-70 factor (ECF subfamily)